MHERGSEEEHERMCMVALFSQRGEQGLPAGRWLLWPLAGGGDRGGERWLLLVLVVVVV